MATTWQNTRGGVGAGSAPVFKDAHTLITSLVFMVSIPVTLNKTTLINLLPQLGHERYSNHHGKGYENLMTIKTAIEYIRDNRIPRDFLEARAPAASMLGKDPDPAPASDVGEVTDDVAIAYFNCVLNDVWVREMENERIVERDRAFFTSGPRGLAEDIFSQSKFRC